MKGSYSKIQDQTGSSDSVAVNPATSDQSTLSNEAVSSSAPSLHVRYDVVQHAVMPAMLPNEQYGLLPLKQADEAFPAFSSTLQTTRQDLPQITEVRWTPDRQSHPRNYFHHPDVTYHDIFVQALDLTKIQLVDLFHMPSWPRVALDSTANTQQLQHMQAQRVKLAIAVNRRAIAILAARVADGEADISIFVDQLNALSQAERYVPAGDIAQQGEVLLNVSVASHYPLMGRGPDYRSYKKELSQICHFCEDGLTILRNMDSQLKQLNSKKQVSFPLEKDELKKLDYQFDAIDTLFSKSFAELLNKLDKSPIAPEIKQPLLEMLITHGAQRKYYYFKLKLYMHVCQDQFAQAKQTLQQLAQFKTQVLSRENLPEPTLRNVFLECFEGGFNGVAENLEKLAAQSSIEVEEPIANINQRTNYRVRLLEVLGVDTPTPLVTSTQRETFQASPNAVGGGGTNILRGAYGQYPVGGGGTTGRFGYGHY